MTDREFADTPFLAESARLVDQLEPYDEGPDRDWDADPASGLISLGYLKAAVRRSASFCFVMTIVGLLIGGGLYVKVPAPYQAQAYILLKDGPFEDGQGTAANYVALAQTPTVGRPAMRMLGLKGSVTSFVKQYLVTVAGLSESVLSVTFSAKSGAAAVSGANDVSEALLNFRKGQLLKVQGRELAVLQQELGAAKQNVKTLTAQESQLQAGQQLQAVKADLQTAEGTVTSAQQAVHTFETTYPPATSAAVNGSNLLSPATLVPRPHLKRILLFPVAGLIGGLALGIAIVLIRAIVSDRLRRRDDIARALRAPVRLSTGPLRRRRRFSVSGLRPGGAAARRENVLRVAALLGRAVAENERGLDALTVVAVDDPVAAALPLVSLARSCAGKGKLVVVADLAAGAPAAKLLRADGPGVSTISGDAGPLAIAVPERDNVLPPGPVGRVAAWDPDSSFSRQVASVCKRADLLLTLITLDASFGADNLRTWAPNAVAMVTAGRSTWTRINAVSEMVRLSGTRLVSAVLVSADRRDESLGEISAVNETGETMAAAGAGQAARSKEPASKERSGADSVSAVGSPVVRKESSSGNERPLPSATRLVSDDTVELPRALPTANERQHRPTPAK